MRDACSQGEMQRRMELADRFVDRLDALPSPVWREIASTHETRHEFYALALQLVNDATQLAGEPLSSCYEEFLGERYRRIDGILARHSDELWDLAPLHLAVMAKAATNALLVRDAHGFSLGAFSELYAPFRRHVDLERGGPVR
jgi:hypothetical protein